MAAKNPTSSTSAAKTKMHTCPACNGAGKITTKEVKYMRYLLELAEPIHKLGQEFAPMLKKLSPRRELKRFARRWESPFSKEGIRTSRSCKPRT